MFYFFLLLILSDRLCFLAIKFKLSTEVQSDDIVHNSDSSTIHKQATIELQLTVQIRSLKIKVRSGEISKKI